MTPVELLQQLIRFDTTNPPGNESECIGFVRNLLEEAGCETQTYAKDTDRPNLVARLQGAETIAAHLPRPMPMRLPADFPVLKIVHAADKRIPVAALEFGTEAVTRALLRF